MGLWLDCRWNRMTIALAYSSLIAPERRLLSAWLRPGSVMTAIFWGSPRVSTICRPFSSGSRPRSMCAASGYSVFFAIGPAENTGGVGVRHRDVLAFEVEGNDAAAHALSCPLRSVGILNRTGP